MGEFPIKYELEVFAAVQGEERGCARVGHSKEGLLLKAPARYRCAHARLLSCMLLACALASLVLAACSPFGAGSSAPDSEQGLNSSRFLVAIEDEPDTVDFQCTSIYYTIATNVFNRLVEMEADESGEVAVAPSLAESWDVSGDGLTYTFHLREGVTFSNGSALTSSDVLYTFTRLLTHPASCNRDIVEPIVGARQLESGQANELSGFTVLSDRDFAITLDEPFEAFLACLSMPGASILDEQTMGEVGERFGQDAASTIGTGSFVLREWEPEKGMLLTANQNCWAGVARCEGLDLRFITEPAEACMMFENGELDILDLDDAGSSSEFFIHGDIYRDRLYRVPRIGTTYIALNESMAPLDDVRVRKALQLSLNRSTLLDAVYGGFGSVVDGIYPEGLYGFNSDLPAIAYAPDEAKALLAEAGHPDGIDFTISVKSSSTQWEMTLVRLAVSMWDDIGARASIEVIDEDEFMSRRKSGQLASYCALWTADFDDPDNFIYTFFGTRENATFRSLCYQRDDVMARIRNARTIADAGERIREYQDLERIVVQDDAAWIPLFSRQRTYVMSERIEGVESSWNGSVKNRYCAITVKEA